MTAVEKFDPSTIVPTASIAIIAPRGSGKSFLSRDLIDKFKHYPAMCVICPSDRGAQYYNTFIPDSYIHYEFSDSLMNQILERQTEMTTKSLNAFAMGKKIDPRLLVVLDDVQVSKEAMSKSRGLKQLFLNGRHYAITFMIILQDAMGIDPSCRTNLDYVFILKNNIITEQMKLHKHYAGVVGKFGDFQKIHTELTKNNGCLVIDNKSDKANVFWYKATEIIGMIKFGNRQFNNFHKKNYRKNWIKENEENYRIIK